MRFEITGKWKAGFEHDGMLFCVQRIEEMLMPYTSHLYKAPVYNTFLLAYEYMGVFDEVEAKTIDQAHLNNILQEFIHSFSNDIVIKEHFSEKQIEYFVSKLNGGSRSRQRRTMEYLIHVIADYPSWSLTVLCNVIENPKEKKKIEKALRSYLPMLLGIGYDSYNIYRVCRKTFSRNDISSTSALDDFFGRFDGADHNFCVYFAVDKRVEIFRSILESRLGISFERDEYSTKFHFNSEKHVCINMNVSALDVNDAARRAYGNFHLFMRYYQFLGNRDEEWCEGKCLVRDDDNECSFPPFGLKRYFYSQDYDDGTLGRSSERIITLLIENAAGNDFIKINKVINAHNAALTSKNVSNSFLNLWSILEIICIDDYNENDSKINRILNNVLPILKRNYINRIVEELHDYMKGNLSSEDYSQLLAQIKENGSEEFKIACLIMLKNYAGLRKEACVKLNQYPLIRSRICQLYEDVFKHKKKYLSELSRYEQRLKWHIQRLYRVRNSIIHSGEANENIVALAEHLHSYVDEVILDIINRMTREKSLGSVANVLLDAQVFIDTISKEYTVEDEFTESDISNILQ